MSSLYNLDLEQSIIAGILQHNDIYTDIESYVFPQDFSSINAPIYSCIQQIFNSKGIPDSLILIDRLNQLGIKLEGIEINDYINSFLIRPVDKENIKELTKELKKKSLIRKIVNNCDQLKAEVLRKQDKGGSEIIGLADKYLGSSLTELNIQDKVGTNLLEVLPDEIERIGNQETENGFVSFPHYSMDLVLGKMRPGQIYINIARRGNAKSLFMLDMVRKIQGIDGDIKTLFLDCEMFERESITRWIAGKINIPYDLIDTGFWRNSKEWSHLVRQELDKIRKGKKNVWFQFIGNMSCSEMISLAKKWYLSQVGRGNKCLIVYDYFKLTSFDKAESSSNKEYEQGYSKIEALKDLAVYCNCPLFSSLQANAKGITRGRHSEDLDESDGIAAITDRISWIPNYMGILRERTHDEILNDSLPGIPAPSHKLSPIKTRNLGIGGPDFMKWVKVKQGKEIKYKPNYINFNIQNFNVEDRGLFYPDFLVKSGAIAVPVEKPREDNLI